MFDRDHYWATGPEESDRSPSTVPCDRSPLVRAPVRHKKNFPAGENLREIVRPRRKIDDRRSNLPSADTVRSLLPPIISSGPAFIFHAGTHACSQWSSAGRIRKKRRLGIFCTVISRTWSRGLIWKVNKTYCMTIEKVTQVPLYVQHSSLKRL